MTRFAKNGFAAAILLGTALAASTAVHADSRPTDSRPADPRLVSRLYNPNEVVTIEGRVGVQASIEFGEDERIENVAIGDSENWQVTPNKRANLLFVKPTAAKARTNLTVVTDRHTYFFDLSSSATAKPLYVLRFTYPVDPAKPKAEVQQASLSTDESAILSGTLEGQEPVDPSKLNFAWQSKGFQKLLPRRIYDDGVSTYLAWGAKQDVPAILILNEKGEEGPVNYAVRDGVIVIEDVPAQIVLRSGSAKATLVNARPASAAEPADTSRLASAAKGN